MPETGSETGSDIGLEMCLEEEKKKCLKNLQNYYKKYGCEQITKLKEYLTTLLVTLTNEDHENDSDPDDNHEKDRRKDEINEIKKQLDLLEDYS